MKKTILICSLAIAAVACNQQQEPAADTKQDFLPSWNERDAKQRVVRFVESATDPSSDGFIPEGDRIAVFDNDGTLWSEQPAYFQLFFTMDRIRAMAADHPEWNEIQPFKAVLENDMDAVMASGEHGLLALVMETHAGMTTAEFEDIVRTWINSARHPRSGKLFKEMVYQPMLELLDYLRANNFKTFIVSGGGIEFMRPWAEAVYGIPPEQIVGSMGKVRYEIREGKPVLVKLPEIDFIDDKEGKPVGIHKFIGKRPVAAFGNSDGDLAMLQWTAAGKGNRLVAYIHHTDEVREWAYDRESHIGRLDRGLDSADQNNWLVVSMKEDWNRIYPFD